MSVVPEAAGSCLPGVPLRVQDSTRAVFAGWQLWAQPLQPSPRVCVGAAPEPCGEGGTVPWSRAQQALGRRAALLLAPLLRARHVPRARPGQGWHGGASFPFLPVPAVADPCNRAAICYTPAIWESTRSPRVPCLSLRES